MIRPARAAALVLAALAPAAPAQDLTRGKLLYENHCSTCHTGAVHGRPERIALSLDQLRAVVTKWQAVQKLGWSPTEVEDVTRYLDATYYRMSPAARP